MLKHKKGDLHLRCIAVRMCGVIMVLFLPHRILKIIIPTDNTLCHLPIVSVTLLEESRNYYLIVILTNITNILIISALYCRDIFVLLTTLHIRGPYKIAV